MTKQEEIREVIWKFLLEYDEDNSNPAVDWAFILLHRLDSQGVVIKAKRELPEKIAGEDDLAYCAGWYDAQLAMAGYAAVESLVQLQPLPATFLQDENSLEASP